MPKIETGPREFVTVTANYPAAEFERVKEAAEDNDMNISEFVRRSVNSQLFHDEAVELMKIYS